MPDRQLDQCDGRQPEGRFAERQDEEQDGVITSRWGTSEAPMRNQFRAWAKLMAAGD